MIQVRGTHRIPLSPATIDVFTGDPQQWLPGPAFLHGPQTWTVEMRAGPIHRAVALSVGRVWRHGETAWRALRWEPVEDGSELLPLESLLPVFVGELGIVPIAADHAELRLRGTYAPPGGLAGAVADHAGLHRVAERTVNRLLEDIAARLPSGGGQGTDRPDGPVTLGTVGPEPRAPRP